jgi:hypoxanthine phosphoribosyltransferase
MFKKYTLAMIIAATALSTSWAHAAPQKRYPSWDELNDLVTEMCTEIDSKDYDILLGVAVGGLVPAALFSNQLKMKNVTTISASSYTNYEQKELRIRNVPEKAVFANKRILLVDDIIDSGITANTLKAMLINEYGAESVTIASLYVNEDHCEKLPEHWGTKTKEWIVFPWETDYVRNES